VSGRSTLRTSGIEREPDASLFLSNLGGCTVRTGSMVRWMVIVGSLLAARGSAQTAPDTAMVELPEVLVRSTRPVTTSGGSGAIRANIDSMSVSSAPTMERVLRAMPAAYVRTNSRGEAEVTVRGSESRQVAILMDGVPLTYAWDGRADVSVIPALAAQEIVFVRGLSTLMHGANAIGGVVEFNTRPAGAGAVAPGLQLRGDVDPDGGYGVAGAVTAPRDLGWAVLSARAGVGFRDSPGQRLARGISEPVPTSDDLRANTDTRETNGFASLRLDGGHGAFLSLSGSGFEAERGIAAQLGVSSARFWRYPFIARGIGVLSGGTGRHRMPWGGRADLRMSAGYDRGRTEIDAYDSRSYTTVTAEEEGDDEVVTLRAVATQSLAGHADLLLGGTYGSIRHDEILNGVENAYRQRLWSVSGQTQVALPARGPVRQYDLSVGATFDGADTPMTGNKPSFGRLDRWGGRVGVAAHLGPGATTLHASVSRRARFPSLRELYSGSLGTFEVNPDLDPEQLVAVEGGVTRRAAWGTLQLVGFHHMLSDAVVRIRPPGGNFQRVNQEGIRSVGGEVLASRAFGALELSGDLVAQDVEVLDPSAGLTRPENMPNVMGSIRARTRIGTLVAVAVETEFTGEQFVIDPETGLESRLAASGRLSVECRRAWALGNAMGWVTSVEARAVADNLTDAAQYDAFGLPLPGRGVRLELRVN
jgi:iron complex outermembrane receptor protein